MSRQIDVNNPDSWDEDDLEYLRSRPETVPEQHRAALGITNPLAPVAAGQSPEVLKLHEFLTREFPDEMAGGESAVDVAIRLLSEDEETVEDDYKDWKVNELRDEVAKRGLAGAHQMNKTQAITALRANDAERAAA